VTDQVSPLGSLAAGSPVLSLPMAKPTAGQGNASPAGSNAANADNGNGTPGTVNASQAAAASAPSGKAAKVDTKQINAQLQAANTSLEFKVDQSSGKSYFKVVDASTGQVIRQVPSAEALAMAQKLQNFAGSQNPSGILVDEEG